MKKIIIIIVTLMMLGCEQEIKNNIVAESRPNILLIMADDAGFSDFS